MQATRDLLDSATALMSASLPSSKSAAAQGADDGVIFADPQNDRSNLPLADILSVSAFFGEPSNRVKILFPIQESSYAWINMSKYYPTAQVMRSGEVSRLPYAIDGSIGQVEYRNRDGETVTVNQHFESKPIAGMVVVNEGKVVYERYKTMRPTDKHIWFSMSKVASATMLALLEHEGKVDVKQPVSHYLPELAGAAWDTVAVEDALDMATGLNGTEHDEQEQNSRTDPDQIWYRWAATADVGLFADVKGRNETWVDVLRAMKRKAPGHERFEYNSINTFVINRIIERVVDKPLSEHFMERIWSRVGMEHDAFYLVSPSGNTLGFLGVNSTLRDLARFGMLFTPSVAKIAGERIIPEALMERFYDRTYRAMYDKGWAGQKCTSSFDDDAGRLSNRYQWDAVTSEGDLYKAGVCGQGLYISPSTDTVAAWFATSDGNNQEETMARAIVKHLGQGSQHR